jgi:hypothetical protein
MRCAGAEPNECFVSTSPNRWRFHMKKQVIALAAALSALAGSALADGVGTAALQSPIAKSINVIAGDAYWTCQASTCTSGGATDQSLTISACKTIVKAAGPVTAYAIGSASLPAAQLAKCNAVAAPH